MRVAGVELDRAKDARVQRVLDHGAAVVVEAPTGFGKSHLIRGLRAASPGAEVLTSIADVRAAGDRRSGSAVVLVDVERPDAGALERIAARDSTETLVVAGRVVDSAVRAVLSAYDHLELGPADLVLTPEEAATLVYPDGQGADLALSDLIHAQADGWPALVAALSRADVASDPAGLRDAVAGGIVHHPSVNRFLRELVAGWPSETRAAIERFATLDRVTVAALEDVTHRDLAQQAARAGVPLVVRDDGWVELPAALREHLGRPSSDDAAMIAPYLARTGGLVPAVRALVSSGSHLAAGAILGDVRPEVLDGTDGAEVLGLLDVLENHIDSPRLKMLRVRAHEHLGDIPGATAAAERVVAECDPGAAEYVDAQLELARVAAMSSQTLDLAPWDDRVTTNEQRVRLDEIRAIQQSQASDPVEVAAGAGGLARVAASWEALGYNARASAALRVMAAVPLSHLGEYGKAIDAAMHARRLSWNRLFDRAVCTSFLALNAGLAGRLDLLDREINAAIQLAESVPVPWLRLYTNWAQLHRCSCLGDARGVAEAAIATERTLDGLEAHSTATVLHADIAVAFAIVGEHGRATEYLARALARRDENPIEVDIAAQIVAARAGRLTEAAERATALRTDPAVPSMRRWRVDLEEALAHGRDADIDRAIAVAASAGSDELARIIVEQATHAGHADLHPRVCILGDPSVQVDGDTLPMPTGKPGELLKLLAMHTGPVRTDLVIDELWPDADLETGLRRLKNPVNRLRGVLGAGSVVRRKGHIALGARVEVDLVEFDTQATRALANHDEPIGVEAAVSALGLYAPVLPGDPLAAASAVAVAAQNRAATLLEIVMAAPSEARPASPWLLDVALRVDRFDDGRLLEVAGIALAEHNAACARRCLAEVDRVADDLDIPRPRQAARLEEELASTT